MYYEDNRLCAVDHAGNEYTVSGGPNIYGTITFAEMDEFNARIGQQFKAVNMSAYRYFLGYASTAVRLRRGVR